MACGCCASPSLGRDHPDHLVPADILFDAKDSVTTAYRHVIEKKLFVSFGEIARFIQIPAAGVETVVSVYRGDDNRYWITGTQPSSMLWETVQHPGGLPAKSGRGIKITRCNAEIPPKLALSIQRVWLKMLADVRPEKTSPGSMRSARKVGNMDLREVERVFYLDGTSEIFTAVDPKGRELRGQRPNDYQKGGHVSALIRIGFLLVGYCDPPRQGRDVVASDLTRELNKFLAK
jgi:hypothetical protein